MITITEEGAREKKISSRNSAGKESMTSTQRISTASSQPPPQPASFP